MTQPHESPLASELDPGLLQGSIFDIQRFSTKDGPGVRTTVFFKGCPLSCKWCSNPESQSSRPQILYYKDLCKGCGECVQACAAGAIRVCDGALLYSRDKCVACGECARACPHEARTLSGATMTVDAVCEEVRKDWRTYMHSGGGVTLGGGEALMQPRFLSAVLAKLHDELGYHTCLDTSGFAPWETLQPLLPGLDLILMDIKHMDVVAHRRMTGVDNTMVLDNIRKLAKLSFPVRIRVPLIPGFNDDAINAAALGEFLREVGYVDVELMPYHKFGLSKYAALGLEYQMECSAKPDLNTVVGILETYGLHITIH